MTGLQTTIVKKKQGVDYVTYRGDDCRLFLCCYLVGNSMVVYNVTSVVSI